MFCFRNSMEAGISGGITDDGQAGALCTVLVNTSPTCREARGLHGGELQRSVARKKSST